VADETLEPQTYTVVELTTSYPSIEEAMRLDPELLARHIARARELHEQGELLMAGAILDPDAPCLQTMAVTASREAAERFVAGDPFVAAGKVSHHRIRLWANMFASR
jgi:uncharacterized protein